VDEDLTFYAVSPTVIVTTLIALVIAMRIHPTRHGWAANWPNALGLAAPLVVAIVGVAAALIVLDTGRPTGLANDLVWLGLASVAGVALVLVYELVKPRADPFDSQRSEPAADTLRRIDTEQPPLQCMQCSQPVWSGESYTLVTREVEVEGEEPRSEVAGVVHPGCWDDWAEAHQVDAD
jgi:hypothetical protein